MIEELYSILLNNGIEEQPAEKMAEYGEYLIQENEKYNLTRITDISDLAVKHFLDSLSVMDIPEIELQEQEILDIGTGPGFPGVPCAIMNSSSIVTMLDSSNKKIQFVENGIRRIGIQNARTMVGRAEEMAHDSGMRERFGTVLSRAVAPLNILLELAAGFVRIGGSFVAYKGSNYEEELKTAGEAHKSLGFEAPLVFKAGVEGQEHTLLVYRKVHHTADKYPRPYGKIKKTPLK
jgi:16S rRNA (guanine527-N7)-methyltransferase